MIIKRLNKAIGYPVRIKVRTGILECSCPACINLQMIQCGFPMRFRIIFHVTVAKVLRSSERFDVKSIGRLDERIIFVHPV